MTRNMGTPLCTGEACETKNQIQSAVDFFGGVNKQPATKAYFYTHRSSSKEPLTENVRKSMTANVKTSACVNFLG